jgi:hydrogenase-4 component F
LLLLGIVFLGMGPTVLAVVQGKPHKEADPAGFRDGFSTSAPILLFAGLVLLLGLYVPPPVESLLREAAAFLEAR